MSKEAISMKHSKTKKFLLQLDPSMRHTLEKHRKKQLWNNLNQHHYNQRKAWLGGHGKEVPLNMTQEQIAKYKVAFKAIDDNKNGILEINEIADAFKFIGVCLIPSQIRHELGLKYNDPDVMDFDMFAKWCFEHEESTSQICNPQDRCKRGSTASLHAIKAFRAPKTSKHGCGFYLDSSVFQALLLWMPTYHRQKHLNDTSKELDSRKLMEKTLDAEERALRKRQTLFGKHRVSMNKSTQMELEWKLFLSRGGSELPEYKQHLQNIQNILDRLQCKRPSVLQVNDAMKRTSSYFYEFEPSVTRQQILRDIQLNRKRNSIEMSSGQTQMLGLEPIPDSHEI